MQPPNRKIILVATGVAAVGLIFLVALTLLATNKSSRQPSSEAIAAVTQYLQAREDSVGADHTTPTAWLDSVKPIITPSWLAALTPRGMPSTGDVNNEYRLAHEQGYVVKATVSGCAWNNILLQSTSSKGAIACGLTDSTIEKGTGQEIPAEQLPFEWTRTGHQAPATIIVERQNGHWLVSKDATGQGQ
jgi:hypothetical protein